MRPRKKPELEQWQRPLVDCRDLGWTDHLGRRWQKFSDILTNPELADPDPQMPIRRRKRYQPLDTNK